ncbi:unnamed protein product [Peronospora farinosa]|uniref:Uncharacterized protein n=1 Tax=Peronospora farinosa TaxID=134698 RepID=A0AAV0TEQ5_9STRA|nr:unnamed protein product [Peronospora farinosa]CAI5720757.1 unnamed protein product [Peronospora farinosa]
MVGSMDLIRDQDRMLTAFSGRTETSSVCWAGDFNQDTTADLKFVQIIFTTPVSSLVATSSQLRNTKCAFIRLSSASLSSS